MSSIEEQLARDIEAVTGGVVVTHTDLDQARDRVEDRIERSTRRGRHRTVLAIAAVAAVAAGVVGVVVVTDPSGEADPAPADSGPDPVPGFLEGDAPTDETVRGVWRVDNGVSLVRFTADGEVGIDTGGQITTPEISGAYALEGDQIVMDLGDAAEPGCGGEVVFRASVRGPDEMRMLATGSAPASCGFEQSGRWVLEHVLPTSRELADIYPPKRGAYGPVHSDVMPGFWLVAGGGHGLQLAGYTYYVLGGAGQVIQLGSWWLDGDDLVLGNDQGCRLRISGVQHISSGADMIRGDLTEYVCMPWVRGDRGDTMEWFRIPDRSSF